MADLVPTNLNITAAELVRLELNCEQAYSLRGFGLVSDEMLDQVYGNEIKWHETQLKRQAARLERNRHTQAERMRTRMLIEIKKVLQEHGDTFPPAAFIQGPRQTIQ